MGAPKVVAKGADLVAAQIRRIGVESNVTQVAAPPLARALYYSTEIGHEIPAALYKAVAQILAYVFQIKTVKQRGGAVPRPPKDWLVPEEYLRRGQAQTGDSA